MRAVSPLASSEAEEQSLRKVPGCLCSGGRGHYPLAFPLPECQVMATPEVKVGRA